MGFLRSTACNNTSPTDFKCNDAIQPRVACLVHLAHAARADADCECVMRLAAARHLAKAPQSPNAYVEAHGCFANQNLPGVQVYGNHAARLLRDGEKWRKLPAVSAAAEVT